MRSAFLFLIAMLTFGSLLAQDNIVNPIKPMSKDLARLAFSNPHILVKNNDADSIYVVSHLDNCDVEVNLEDEDSANYPPAVIGYVFDRGDTLLCKNDFLYGYVELYKTNDGCHVSSLVETYEDGSKRTSEETIELECTDHECKKIVDRSGANIVISTYGKDTLIEKHYKGDGKEPYMTVTFTFDTAGRPLTASAYDNNGESEVRKITYDKSGIWTSFSRTAIYDDGTKDESTNVLVTELNERGDWIATQYYVDGEMQGCVKRKIFYKK